MSLDELVDIFRRYLYLPDPGPLEIVLGTVVANRLRGDPVWLLLIGPPSSGKSELLVALSGLDCVHEVSTFTEPGLLAGSVSRRPGATGGLLAELGSFGIIVCKDFTSLLSEAPQTRSGLLAALREIYDGQWVRRLGSDGGRTLAWRGKAGLLAAVTEVIDQHAAVIGAMGERFACYRMPALDDEGRLAQARAAQHNTGRQAEMRAELKETVAVFLAGMVLPDEPEPLADEEAEALVLLADLATRCRSAIERNPRDREVELVPQAEAASRLLAVLTQLVRGLSAMGIDREEIGRLVVKVALDGMTKARRAVIGHLLAMSSGVLATTAVLADALGLPTGVVARTLEDLAAHGIAERHADGNRHRWGSSIWLKERWVALDLPLPTNDHRRGQ